MKMSKQLYERLSAKVEALDNPRRRAAYAEGGLSSERYRWDLFWSVCGFLESGLWDKEIADLKDDHIDTALRRIVPKLTN